MVYVVTDTLHGMKGLELSGGNPDHHRFLRWAVMMNQMDHPAYRLGGSSGAGAFLQSRDDDPWYTLVEFWRPDVQPFVDWLNENVDSEVENMRSFVVW